MEERPTCSNRPTMPAIRFPPSIEQAQQTTFCYSPCAAMRNKTSGSKTQSINPHNSDFPLEGILLYCIYFFIFLFAL